MEFKLEMWLTSEEIRDALVQYLLRRQISTGAPWQVEDVIIYSLNLQLARIEIKSCSA